jgi:hypothetical protein
MTSPDRPKRNPGNEPSGAEPSDAPAASRTERAPDPDEPVQDPRPEPLACGECGREIPPDEAVVAEGQEYIMYFCSPGCHAAWSAARQSDPSPPLDPEHTPRHKQP